MAEAKKKGLPDGAEMLILAIALFAGSMGLMFFMTMMAPK